MTKEHQHVEWKESWRDEYLKWICGFANAEGGVLEIGRNDAGTIVGLNDAKRLLEEIPNKVRDLLGILVEVNLQPHAPTGREFVQIVVDPYPYPVSYKGQYHVRSGSTKQELKGAALDRFLLRKQGRHWDGVPVPHVALSDLSAPTLADFRQRAARSKRLSTDLLAEPDADLIHRLHLTDGAYLKRAAVLLFHPDPECFVTGAYVKIGHFQAEADLLYQDEVHGPLFEQVRKTLELLQTKYLKARISYEGVQRVETWPVPEEALREAVLNAIAHKDYASGVPIQISVFDDHLMLWNPGPLPPNWTVARLLDKHASQPFNPDVANAFFRAGMIEAWGRGIERMRAACVAAGVPEPTFRADDGNGLWSIFRFLPSPDAALPVETRVETRVEIPAAPVETPARILALLAANPQMTLVQVAATLGRARSTIERAVAQLVRQSRLRFVGPRKGGHWEVLP
jgi:ATP-dependent DNA helicase RecG